MIREYTINFGLLKKDMKTPLNKVETLNKITKKFNSIGIKGFSSNISMSCYEKQLEESLNINFINTFGVQEEKLKEVLGELRDEFEQDSILLRSREVDFKFI